MSPRFRIPDSGPRLDITSGFALTTREVVRPLRILRVPRPTPDPPHERQRYEKCTVMRPVLRQFRRNKIMTGVVTVILAVTAGVVTLRETFGQMTVYTVSELSGGVPWRLNNFGDVAGKGGDSPSGEILATIWHHGSRRHPKHLGKLHGGEYSSASGINDAGEVAGEANTAESIVPFVGTERGGLRRIPLLPGDNGGQAFGINRHGHVVGYSSGPNGTKAFLWTRSGDVHNLGVWPAGNYSRAGAVTDLEELAGTSG